MNKIKEFWKKMKKSQRVLLFVVLGAMIVAIAVVTSVATQVNYTVLYSDLSTEEAGQVFSTLQEMGVDVKPGMNGTILVPREQADSIRLQLVTQGYPKTGLNYDIYSNASSFGMTDADKAMYNKFQLEQNLSQQINNLDKIKSSTVMITLPENSQRVLTEDMDRTATASIVVEVKQGETLTNSDADTIRQIAAMSIPSLVPESITISDTKLHSYPAGGGQDGTGAVNEQLELQTQVNNKLQQQIINLLAPLFGAEKISVAVNATLDFDKELTNSITLSPPVDDAGNNGIAVSMKEVEERILNATNTAGGEPGVDANGGAATPVYPEVDAAAGDATYYNVSREVNYEVNEINKQLEKAQGQIEELEATVFIDGGEELNDVLPIVQQAVTTAIGVSTDKLTVSAMPFKQNELYQQALEEQETAFEQMRQDQLRSDLIMLGIIVGIILIVLGVVMSMLKKKRNARLEQEQRLLWEEGQRNIDIAADEDLNDLLRPNEDSLIRIQSLVKKDPQSIAQLLRNWLMDDFRG